jgi:hypothetical protein
VRRTEGGVTLLNSRAIDLDSTGPGWHETTNAWTDQDMSYWANQTGQGIVSRYNVDEAAVLPPNSARTYGDCASARYGDPRNPPRDDAVAPGRAVCIRTSNERLALIAITGYTPGRPDYPGSLTATITVWNPPG